MFGVSALARSSAGPADACMAVVTVTFHPDLRKLKKQVGGLPRSALSFIVDNGSEAWELDGIRDLVSRRPNTFLIENARNLGLATAMNQGIVEATARLDAQDFVLLMDQDSEPRAGSIDSLMSAFAKLEREGRPVGCVGPQLLDETTGLSHGFHCIRGWRWVRVFPCAGSTTPVNCANLNGSGTLVRLSLYKELNGLDESLFIDHVDTEWVFKVLAHGYEVLGIPQAVFNHSMGEQGLRFWWGRWRVWPKRSPLRHFYLFRNTVRLLRRSYVPVVWKIWAPPKLVLTFVVYAMFDSRRVEQIRQMTKGIISGCRG